MEPRWLDLPFFTLVENFTSLQAYFIAQAIFIGKIVLTLNLGFIAIKYMARGEGLTEQMTKVLTSVILFLILISAYPKLIQGLSSVVYQWSYGATYAEVSKMIQKTTEDGKATEFWAKKGDKADDSYSDIIRVIEEETGSGNIAKKYVLDIFDHGTEKRPGMFIRPNAIMRLLMLSFENIWNRVLLCLKGFPLKSDIGGAILLTICGLVLLLCGILASLQYFICALEFTLISSVGVIMMPFMLWDGTKFLTEKLVGALVGFTVKLLFVTIAMMLTINGYLALMVKEFNGFVDQTIYTIFVSLFYMMICQNGPQLAVSLLTGSPQMSLGEGMVAAATLGGAAAVGAKGVKKGVSNTAKTAVKAKSAVDTAKGASAAAKEDSQKEGQSKGAQRMAGMKAGLQSIGQSGKESLKSGIHRLGASLTASVGGKSGAMGGNSNAGNRFSTLERRNEANSDGKRKTGKEFAQENKARGAERYQAQKAAKQKKESDQWKSSVQNTKPSPRSSGRYDGGTPLGQEAIQRNTTPSINQTNTKENNNGESSQK